jgi:acyl-CoA reductase-like NAD-dependent aldehyde dehydrogenase
MKNLRTQLFIDNQWVDSVAGDCFETVDPSNETVIAKVSRARSEDVDLAAKAASRAMQGPWPRLPPVERGTILFKLADLIDGNSRNLAKLETIDVGKPLSDSLGDIAGVSDTIRYNAGAADKLEGATIPIGPDHLDFSVMEPIGVTGHIMPWNYPLGMAARSVAPALVAGCSAILKPAEQSPLSTLAFAELCEEAGFPSGVVNVVPGFGNEAGAALTSHPLVRGISFTGSVATGRAVYQSAAVGLKKVVLELGGKNPMIVFPDADLDQAASDAVVGAYANSGQVCSASSLLFLHEDIREGFLARFTDISKKLTIGGGMDDRDLGPLASSEQYDRVRSFLDGVSDQGVRVLFGGGRPSHMDRGYFIEPTLIECPDLGQPIARQEVFGPVAVVIAFAEQETVVEMINDLDYGLVAGIYTRDISRALRLVSEIDAGTIWINGWYIGGAQVPTGGNKASGIGRERGLPGIANYLELKNVGIRI